MMGEKQLVIGQWLEPPMQPRRHPVLSNGEPNCAFADKPGEAWMFNRPDGRPRGIVCLRHCQSSWISGDMNNLAIRKPLEQLWRPRNIHRELDAGATLTAITREFLNHDSGYRSQAAVRLLNSPRDYLPQLRVIYCWNSFKSPKSSFQPRNAFLRESQLYHLIHIFCC